MCPLDAPRNPVDIDAARGADGQRSCEPTHPTCTTRCEQRDVSVEGRWPTLSLAFAHWLPGTLRAGERVSDTPDTPRLALSMHNVDAQHPVSTPHGLAQGPSSVCGATWVRWVRSRTVAQQPAALSQAP